MKEQEHIRRCRFCGDIIDRRYNSQRMFCAEKYGVIDKCKNDHHNLRNRKKEQQITGLKRKLFQNKAILKRLLGDQQEAIVSNETLLNEGYSMDIVLHLARYKDTDQKMILQLDYGLMAIQNDKIKIFKHGKKFNSAE